MNNARTWLLSLTPEQRTAHQRAAAKRVRNRKNVFQPGDPRAVEAGRRGGFATRDKRRAAGPAGKPSIS